MLYSSLTACHATYCPNPSPIDMNIIHHRIELAIDPVVLTFREDNVSSIPALFEGMQYVWDIALVASLCCHGALLSRIIASKAHTAGEGVRDEKKQDLPSKRRNKHSGQARGWLMMAFFGRCVACVYTYIYVAITTCTAERGEDMATMPAVDRHAQ